MNLIELTRRVAEIAGVTPLTPAEVRTAIAHFNAKRRCCARVLVADARFMP